MEGRGASYKCQTPPFHSAPVKCVSPCLDDRHDSHAAGDIASFGPSHPRSCCITGWNDSGLDVGGPGPPGTAVSSLADDTKALVPCLTRERQHIAAEGPRRETSRESSTVQDLNLSKVGAARSIPPSKQTDSPVEDTEPVLTSTLPLQRADSS